MNSEHIKLKCTNVNEEGKGIVKVEKNKFYIPYLIDGEVGNIDVFHTKTGMSAKLISVVERSPYRVFPNVLTSINVVVVSCNICHMKVNVHLSKTLQTNY